MYLEGGKKEKQPTNRLSTSCPETCQHSLNPRLIGKKIKELTMTTWLNALIVTARHEAEEHESWGVVRAVHAGVRRGVSAW